MPDSNSFVTEKLCEARMKLVEDIKGDIGEIKTSIREINKNRNRMLLFVIATLVAVLMEGGIFLVSMFG